MIQLQASSDQCLFFVREKDYQAFIKALDNPPLENKKLKKLLNQKPPWDK